MARAKRAGGLIDAVTIAGLAAGLRERLVGNRRSRLTPDTPAACVATDTERLRDALARRCVRDPERGGRRVSQMSRSEPLPSAGALEEVRRIAGSSAVILDVARLDGGQHADTWRVDTA